MAQSVISRSTPGPRPLRLADWPSPTIDRPALPLVPVGSCEQHGQHLPLDTDSLITTAVADSTCTSLREEHGIETLTAPPLLYGASGEHQAYAGTTSIGTHALVTLLIELVRSCATWSNRVVFVNGHGGNVDALTTAVATLREQDHDAASVACDISRRISNGDAHAGRVETSLMLALEPDRVDLGRAQLGNTAPLTELLPAMRAGGVAAVSPNGILGDPTAANAEEGRQFLDSMTIWITDLVLKGAADEQGRLALTVSAQL